MWPVSLDVNKEHSKELDMKRVLIPTLCVVLAGAMAPVVLAVPLSYDIDKDPTHDLYGWLNQNHIPGVGGVMCGPTAAVNSFVYLENKYPNIYNSSLIPAQAVDQDGDGDVDFYDDMIAVALTLGGAGFMKTIANNTTWHDDFIYGKYLYLEQQVPNVTIYEAEDHWPWGNHANPPPVPKPNWVINQFPTWQFLWDELNDCEDVELLFSWYDGGHYVTLKSFHWVDANGNMIIDAVENAWIDFIDPCTGANNIASIWNAWTGNEWKLEGVYDSYDMEITMAVSESPIPLPPAAWFGLALLGGLVATRRRAA